MAENDLEKARKAAVKSVEAKSVETEKKNANAKPKVVLVLQGGGALGAYHIGALQAMVEKNITADWVSGISIGAINAAVIAGNEPKNQLSALEKLWDTISWPISITPEAPLWMRRAFNSFSNGMALMFGQPGFFYPRLLNPMLWQHASPDQLSFCDTAPLLNTLAQLSDFERINQQKTRLSLGATSVSTGELVFFDNKTQQLNPHHVLASGSLPPGFPATEIDGQWYWDGGCVSNTPLAAIMDDLPDQDTLVLMVDLWQGAADLPTTMDGVTWRSKQIQYASRTSKNIEDNVRHYNAMSSLHKAHQQGHVDIATLPVSADKLLRYRHALDIVHITYRPSADQISSSDAEFSRSSIAERRAAGYVDMKSALELWQADRERKKTLACHLYKQAA
ncbi:MAG: patatin-like phospholipase family protein [Alphaproteobacteria bacterium]